MAAADSTRPIRFTSTCRDLTGERFGRLKVVSFFGRNKWGNLVWQCKCDCGNVRRIPSGDLLRGNNQSCGCLAAERSAARKLKHGLSHLPEYKIWGSMISRCYKDDGTRRYKDYGGRGITVCQRWRDSFEAFLADMGRRPSKRHSIDRKDNEEGYNPENCRWATPTEQARNTSRNSTLTHNGETLTIAEWAERLGVRQWVIHNRIRYGWSVQRILETPRRKLRPYRRNSDKTSI